MRVRCANLALELPLAIVELGLDGIRITHLLTRVEKHATHFIRPPILPERCTPASLLETLREAFELNHLYLNNFECYYLDGAPNTELKHVLRIVGDFDYQALSRSWYGALADRCISGFYPQLGNEIEHWSYDIDLSRIHPGSKEGEGCISVMRWSRKRKASPDEAVGTYRKKLYRGGTSECRTRNYADEPIHGDAPQALASFFQVPISSLPSLRRTHQGISCECAGTGNIFVVGFEDSRVRNERAPHGRSTLCRINYAKTRGRPVRRLISADLAALADGVEAFLRSLGLTCERTDFSTLTFLEKYASEAALHEKSNAPVE